VPIHDQGYRRYQGTRAATGRAWAVITREGVRTLLARRAFIALMLLAWLPAVVRAVQIYAATNVPQAQFLAPDAKLFRNFLEQQEVFLFFITVYAGTGLIANDRRANALQIYLSKPLTRAEYVCGKFGVLFVLLLSVTWVPAVLLLVIQILFTGSFRFVLANLFLLPAITVYSLVQVTAVGLAMLALSSLSKSSRYVGVLYAGLIFFSQAVYGIVRGITGDSTLAWLSVPLDLQQIGDAIFRIEPRFHMPVWSACLVIGLLIAVSAIVLERRVRGIEVVA
jgi:ABC-2 type transport system permease protein